LFVIAEEIADQELAGANEELLNVAAVLAGHGDAQRHDTSGQKTVANASARSPTGERVPHERTVDAV